MRASRRATVVAAAALASTLAACDALLGLGDYGKCPGDCADVAEAGSLADVRNEGNLDSTAFETGSGDDGGDGGADAEGGLPGDGGWDGPGPHQLWAHWPMPNPDAAIGPDASTQLPHPMTYDAGADGGASTVYDVVTGLTWRRVPLGATSIDAAWKACLALGSGSRVPTRIELVSLIDFTQPSPRPTLDPSAFPGVDAGALYWTSSAVPADGAPPAAWWQVSLVDGTVFTGNSATSVLCVSGGTP